MTEVEERARKICAQFGADPDEVLDDYGPVLRWHDPGYHLNEIQTDAEDKERDRIVEWLRWDAGETRTQLTRLHKMRTLNFRQTEEWETLIKLKTGIADAISRGDHMKGSTND